VKRTVQE